MFRLLLVESDFLDDLFHLLACRLAPSLCPLHTMVYLSKLDRFCCLFLLELFLNLLKGVVSDQDCLTGCDLCLHVVDMEISLCWASVWLDFNLLLRLSKEVSDLNVWFSDSLSFLATCTASSTRLIRHMQHLYRLV